jgi:anti-sigma regulatory factor (Ser/Thr protein kinase)
MSDRPLDLLVMEVPCDRKAPAVVRSALAQIDCGWSVDDGILVATELVNNAVLHSGCMSDHRLKVRATVQQDRLLISVHDPGRSGEAAHPRRTDVSEPGGWGLRIVEQLSHRWGSERPDGYLVWAELPIEAYRSTGRG